MRRFFQHLPGFDLLLDDDPSAGGGGGAPGGEDPAGPDPAEDPAAAAQQRPFEAKMRALREELEQEQQTAARALEEAAGIDPDADPDDDPDGGDDPDIEEGGEQGAAPGQAGGAAAGEGGDDDDGEFLVVALPARRKGDPDFELPLDRAMLEELGLSETDVVERVNQLKNGAMYRAEAEEAISAAEARHAELDGIYEAMAEDPAGFLTENVAAGHRAEVVESLLMGLEPEAFDAIVRKIDGWARDPDSRETAATKAENARLRAQQERTTRSGTKDAQAKLVRDITTAIRSVLPDDVSPRKARMFERQAAAELREYAREHKLTELDPAKIPEILAELAVAEEMGIPSRNGGSSSAGGDPPKASGKNGGDGKKPSSSAAGPKGKQPDVRERLRRRKSATTTPAGAGSAASAGFKKVPGERYEDRRNRVAKWLGLPEKKTSAD